MRLLISAGEASGEMYGAQLLAVLRRRLPAFECFGVGGERMQVAGCELVVHARELAVVGITEILPRLPKIYREFRRLLRAIDARQPHAAIIIDSPGFNLKVARELHRRRVPVIYYVAPQFWAWRSGRVKLIRRYVNKALVIFPFEQRWYRERGVDAEYVGHPLADVESPTITRENFAAENRLDPKKPWIALLPGSRRKEITMNLPAMCAAARQLAAEYRFVLPVAPTVNAGWLDTLVRPHRAEIKLVHDTRAALLHARAAVVASGTATIEAAMMGTPMVVVYRVAPLTWALGRPLVHVKNFAMVNLVAGRQVVPELMQSQFTPENVAARLHDILRDGPAREKMLGDLAEVRARLKSGSDGRPAAERAADAVLRLVT